jgi:hypothetical protein
VGVKAWALRRLLGRFRITDDIVGHLTTLQRLGETVEVELPRELLPVGARTVLRAVRTRAAVQVGAGWVWPWWLERQIDPAGRAFIPRGQLPFLVNVTARNWTMVGNVGSPWEAIVDPRGLVTPWFDGWSLDWWVGATDRWHFPSREVAVRQRLVGVAPVVETAMAVPGGDAVERVYAVRAGEELVVVEVENRSRAPFVVAFAVRPYNPEGLAVVRRIALHGSRTVTVDGRPALLFPRPPAAMVGSTFHGGDVAESVVAGRSGPELPELRCDAGLAQAAFFFPVAHGASVRVALPLVPQRPTRRRRLARRRAERFPALPANGLPEAAAVARGWDAHARRGMRVELPDERLTAAVEANRRYMLLFHDGADITPGPATYHRFWFRDAAYMVAALDRYGFHAEAAEVIRHFGDRLRLDGFFFSQRHEWDANGCALWTMAEHWRLTGDLEPVDVDAVARAVRWIDRKRRSGRRRDAALEGLMPAGIAAEHLGPYDHYYWDSWWSLRGLLDGAALLRAKGRPAEAAVAERWAAELRAAIEASLRVVAERLGTHAMPAGPRRRVDAGSIGSLVACWPLGLLAPDDPAVVATVDAIRERFCLGPAFFQGISHTGLGTYLTLQLAFVELLAGDPRAFDRLSWLLDAATPTFTWPEAIHPQLGGGCMGDGHHGWAAAEFLSFVRCLLVREAADGLVLCALVPEGWFGRGIEVHDAPTHWGTVSFAVRWHGDRPALLWELSPRSAGTAAACRIRAPGLDPSWSTQAPSGEVLLAPVAPGVPTSFT